MGIASAQVAAQTADNSHKIDKLTAQDKKLLREAGLGEVDAVIGVDDKDNIVVKSAKSELMQEERLKPDELVKKILGLGGTEGSEFAIISKASPACVWKCRYQLGVYVCGWVC